MLSVGIDLVEINRIRRSISRPRFVERVYGPNERQYFALKGLSAQSAAAAFAAKEAFSKAMGTGICGFSLTEVELLHNERGAPFLQLSGRAKQLADERGLHFSVSLTHAGDYAAAVVIANTQGGCAHDSV